MSKRITEKMLQNTVNSLNKLTNNLESIVNFRANNEAGNVGVKYNVGTYTLDFAMGGIKLEQIKNENGGTTDILSCGYTTKRNLFNLIHAYIAGIKTEQDKH